MHIYFIQLAKIKWVHIRVLFTGHYYAQAQRELNT